MNKNKIYMGSFNTSRGAREAVYDLEARGVPVQAISIILPEDARENFVHIETKSRAPEGAAAGGAAGMALGGLAAGLAGVASLAIPGIGIFAAGPIVAALAGAGVGGAAGGAIGALIGLGIDENEAKFHTSTLKEGGVVVAVSSTDSVHQATAKEVFKQRAIQFEVARSTDAHI